MHLHENLITTAFRRLGEPDPTGKRGMERTSCLMYFLAFDELAAERDEETILFDPDSAAGLANRNEYAARYSNLVRVGWGKGGEEWVVSNLGKVNTDGHRTSEKKFSGDFLTVPLKRASQAAEPQPHPKRPSPLLLLGVEVNRKKWGISRHDAWPTNSIAFLSDRASSTPWTDLAVFVFRDSELDRAPSLQEALIGLLEKRFSKELVPFWKDKINSEARRFVYTGEWLQENLSYALRRLVEGGQLPGADDLKALIDENERLREDNRELRAQNMALRRKFGLSFGDD